MVARTSSDGAILSTTPREDVVEVLLLLNATRMEALVDLSRRRGQSVGQLVRGLIDRELARPEPCR
jgi:hypothetical protein